MVSASENPFKENLTSLPKPGGGEFGKFYSLPSLNDPRIGNSFKLTTAGGILFINLLQSCFLGFDSLVVLLKLQNNVVTWLFK